MSISAAGEATRNERVCVRRFKTVADPEHPTFMARSNGSDGSTVQTHVTDYSTANTGFRCAAVLV
jgi:hypothetical protein